MNAAFGSALLGMAVAFAVSSVVIPLSKKIAVAIRAVEYPGMRREQSEAVPRLGGVAAVLGLFVGGGCVAFLRWGSGMRA